MNNTFQSNSLNISRFVLKRNSVSANALCKKWNIEAHWHDDIVHVIYEYFCTLCTMRPPSYDCLEASRAQTAHDHQLSCIRICN